MSKNYFMNTSRQLLQSIEKIRLARKQWQAKHYSYINSCDGGA
jgi:hypothetical protein